MAFKVIREDISGDLFGAIVGFQEAFKIAPIDTPYKIGTWCETRPDMAELGYYLMYFNSLRTAKRFWRKHNGLFLPLFIHECEVRDSKPVPEWVVVAWKTNTTNDIKRQLLTESVRLHKPFPGTRCAQAIKLGERVC